LRETLTKSEQRVVDSIIANPQEVIYASVAELAERSKVSDPTVVRTCKKLGLNGYQDLKITLAKELVNPLQAVNEEILPGDDTHTVANKVFQSTIRTLNFTHDTLNMGDIDRAVQRILQARKIVIVGVGNSHAISLDLQHKLMRLGMDAVAFSDPHLATIALSYMDERDLAFCISHSGSSREVVDLAALAKQNHIATISLTNIGISPLSRIADIALHTSSSETRYRIFGLNSRIAQLAIIDTLYTLIVLRNDMDKMLVVESALKSRKY
jgi:RpiR family carbohydrate utilization transcriptional regulator